MSRCCARIRRWFRRLRTRSSSGEGVELAHGWAVGDGRPRAVVPSQLHEPSEGQLRDPVWRRAAAERWIECSGAGRLRNSCSVEFQEYASLEPGTEEIFQEAISTINKDIPRTLPGSFRYPLWRELLGELHARGGYEESLRRILVALVRRLQTGERGGRRGYTQGMSHLVAIMLLFTGEPADTFWLLACMVESMLLPDFYCEPPAALNGVLAEAGVVLYLLDQTAARSFPLEDRESTAQMLTVRMGVPLLVDVVPPGLTLAVWDRIFTVDHSPDFLAYAIAAAIGRAAVAALSPALPHLADDGLSGGSVPLLMCALDMLRDPEDGSSSLDASPLLLMVEELAARVPAASLARARAHSRGLLAAEWGKPHNLQDLQRSCHFTAAELEALQARFIQQSSEGHAFQRPQLAELLQALGVSLPEQAQERLLDAVVDRDGSGSFDFREVCCLLSCICLGTIQERLNLVFVAYDSDGSGFLESEKLDELAQALAAAARASFGEEELRSGHRPPPRREEQVRAMRTKLTTMDLNGDGKLSREEFLLCAPTDPHVLFAFGLHGGQQGSGRALQALSSVSSQSQQRRS